MKYLIKLKYGGRTIYKMKTEEMTPEELDKAEEKTLRKFERNIFTRNLPLVIESIEL
jgi:hypothetical protein